MRFKTKVLLWLFFKFISFVFISVFLSLFWLKTINLNFEKKLVEEQKEEIFKYFETEKKRLEFLARDWAFWDDAYFFVLHKKKEFIKANFNKETFLNNRLSILAYLDLRGSLILGGYFEKFSQKIVSLNKSWLKEHFNYYKKSFPLVNLGSVKSGFTFYENKPHFICFYPVSDSEGKKDPVGILIMARPIDEEFITFLKEIFNVREITFTYLNNLPGFVSSKIDLIGDRFTVKLLLKDFFDKNIILEYTIFRKFYFEKYLFYFIGIQILFLFLIYFLFYFYIKKVFKNLKNIKADIEKIKKDEKEKINGLKYDEFLEIVEEFNSLYNALKEKIKEVEYSKKIYQLIAEKVDLPIALFDSDKNLVYANVFWYDCFSEEDIKNIKKLIEKCEKNEKFYDQYITTKDKYFKLEIVPVKEYSFYYLLIGHRVDVLIEDFTSIFERAVRDPLTRLYNRYYLKDTFKRIQGEVLRGEIYTILWIDVDDLKYINDTYGHLAGDEFLKFVAEVIKRNCRTEDLSVRWGGDEFLVILKTDIEGAKKVAQRILKEISEKGIIYKDIEIKGTVSMGIARVSKISLEELLEKLDKMLYEAKFKGKGNIRVLEET